MIGITNAGGNISKFGIRLLNDFPAIPKEGDIVVYYGLGTATGEITPWNFGEDRVDQAQEGYTFIHIDSAPQQFPVTFWAILHERDPLLGLSCYWGPVLQKQNGKYKRMTAKLYAGGEWKQISQEYNGELFANGNQYTEYTGGWVSTANCQNGWYVDGSEKWIWPHAPALEISTVMKIWQTSNPWVGTVFTGKAVDVTNYSKLYVDLQYNCIGAGVNNGFNVCVTKSNGNNFTPLAEYNVDTGNGNKSYDGTIAIDLSSISGEVYVAIASHQHGGVDTGNNIVNIRKIWRA